MKTIPLTQSDFKGHQTVYIRTTTHRENEFLVTTFTPEAVYLTNVSPKPFVTYKELAVEWEWSTNRDIWRPCTKDAPEATDEEIIEWLANHTYAMHFHSSGRGTCFASPHELRLRIGDYVKKERESSKV